MASKSVRISLANKCQLLFGGAVVLILTAALSVVWLQLESLVREAPRKRARDLAQAWLADRIQLGGALAPIDRFFEPLKPDQRLKLTLLEHEEFDMAREGHPFVARAVRNFEKETDLDSLFEETADARGKSYFRYAWAVRRSDLLRIGGPAAAEMKPKPETPELFDPLEMILFVQLRDPDAQHQRTLNYVYLLAAGLLAGLLAIGVFWFVTTHIILSPVRLLRETAEHVAAGDLQSRADINTGDEFERLSDVFNQMLDNLNRNQNELYRINKSLDLKVNELAEHNVALDEANKIKSEFLANVSHELRTPLNSMIGFAEILEESLKHDEAHQAEKRRRYVHHIHTASKQLLNLINDLLDLAKIEAGRMEVRTEPVVVADTAEGLVNLMRPQADKRRIGLELDVAEGLPLIHTDPGKLHQILFNFLSNAIKFTPEGGTVTLSARSSSAGPEEQAGRIHFAVTDTGPGIAPEMRSKIFDKFTQLDSSMTKAHQGTGLGLAISRELAHLLQGEIGIESELGRGTTFTLTLPTQPVSERTALMPEATTA